MTPRVGKPTLGEDLKAFMANRRMNGRKSVDDAERKTAGLLEHFRAERRMVTITSGNIESNKAARLEAQAAPATVNRELAALRRAFQLAVRAGDLVAMPYVGMLAEHNTRVGFFEREEFEAI